VTEIVEKAEGDGCYTMKEELAKVPTNQRRKTVMPKREKLTREEAVRQCKELWTMINESGCNKRNFFETDKRAKKFKKYSAHCPLCQYVKDIHGKCYDCPIKEQYGVLCWRVGYSSRFTRYEWTEAIMNLKETKEEALQYRGIAIEELNPREERYR
jgi:hypothetical protein